MPLSYRLTFVCLLAFYCGFALDSLRTEKIDGRLVVVHEVEKGETLYSLSKRYGAEINEVISFNRIENNALSLGQLLRIPYGKSVDTQPMVKVEDDPSETFHEVKTGETLFSISQLYGLRVYQLKEMNGLNNNEISIGQQLVVKNMKEVEPEPVKADTRVEVSEEPVEAETPDDSIVTVSEVPTNTLVEEDSSFISYQVQSGDDLTSIASRYGIQIDSLVYWNELTTDILSIGQELRLKQKVDEVIAGPKIIKTPYGIKKRMIDPSGFVRIQEEGIALKIEDAIPTDKYLCLHRDQPVGSLVEVRNLMNNQKVFVKVVAKLPNTGLNENVLIRLTPPAFKRLGIIDPRARVEISYYEE